MPGLSDPHHVDRFGQSRPCDQVLIAIAVVLILNDEHGLADVLKVAEPVPLASFLVKRIAENQAASCTCSVERFGHDGSSQ